MGWVLLVVLILLAASWLWARREANRAEPPKGKVLYRDTEQGHLEETLFSERHGLVGPDYIISGPDGKIPVELKKGGCPARGPYQNHQAQLFGYPGQWHRCSANRL